MPAWSSPSPSSRAEQSIPCDSTPRMADFLISIPLVGMIVPTLASATLMPARAFGAPQTTCSSPCAAFTLQTRSLSACGCFSASMISATTNGFSACDLSSTDSTSRPMAVSVAAMVSSEASVARNFFSIESGNFTRRLP